MCPFCSYQEKEISNDTFYTTHDWGPATADHILIIPDRHVTSFTELTPDELHDFQNILNKLVKQFVTHSEYDSYNLGINCGASAGQTIEHLHIHFFPRKKGDHSAPKGGVRQMFGSNTPYEH